MGKYNFNYEKLNVLEKENADLRASNAQLCARLEKLEKMFEHTAQGGKRTIPPHLDQEKYTALFGLKITGTGELRRTDSLTQMSNWFAAFRQNILRVLFPAVSTSGGQNRSFRLICRDLESLTEDEFEIVIETFQSVIDLLFYAKGKLDKIKNSGNDTQEG